ncbi:MAG: hypothetical protein V7L21_30430 [Nostoc sp.]
MMFLTQFWDFGDCDRLIYSRKIWSLMHRFFAQFQPMPEMP